MTKNKRPETPQWVFGAMEAARRHFRGIEFQQKWLEETQEWVVIWWPMGQRNKRVAKPVNREVRNFVKGYREAFLEPSTIFNKENKA